MKQEIYKKHVFVCTTGKTCSEQHADEVMDAMRAEIAKRGLKKEIRINKAGCMDQCGNGPMAVVYPEGVWYAHLSREDAEQIVEEHLVGGNPVERCLYDGRGRLEETRKPEKK